MVDFLTDDLGNRSWLRKNLTKAQWFGFIIVFLSVVQHLFVLRGTVEALWSAPFLTFVFGWFSIVYGSKIGQKVVEKQSK